MNRKRKERHPLLERNDFMRGARELIHDSCTFIKYLLSFARALSIFLVRLFFETLFILLPIEFRSIKI